MNDEHDVAGRQIRKSCRCARDLIDKAFAAGRPVAGGRFPEFAIDVAELGDEVVVAPPGPLPKILFAKIGVLDRV